MAFQENDGTVLDRDRKLLKRYYCLLNNKLSFPFPAVYRKPIGITEDATHLVIVVGLCDPSEHPTEHGLLCRAVLHGKTIELPLVEVEVSSDSPYFELIEDYWSWAWNDSESIAVSH